MAKFRVFHQAPGGPKMYAYGIEVTLSTNPEIGKIYGRDDSSEDDDKKQLAICRKNFETVFGLAGKEEPGMPALEYRTGPHFMGAKIEDIQSNIEYL